MSKLSLLACVAWLSICTTIRAQFPNSLGSPSPNSSFLRTIGGAPTSVGVDLYTGTAQVNVPVCDLASKDMTIPVSLTYTHGKGIKVQDYATCAGLGWQLQAGGSVTRIVRGFPDEFPNGYLGTGRWGQKITNHLVNGTPYTTADRKAITGGGTADLPTADGEPDIYFVKTASFAFQFTFNGDGEPVLSNSNGFLITAPGLFNTSSYQSPLFVITDPNGNEYHFSTYSNGSEYTKTKLYGTEYTYPTTWNLNTIFTNNKREVINFSYIASPNDEVYRHFRTLKRESANCTTVELKEDTVTNTIIQPKYISSIQSSLGEINFSYAFDRRDVAGAARLLSVSLKSYTAIGTSTLQTYTFNYGYFGDPSTDLNVLRLRLDNIFVAGGTANTATPVQYRTFTYHNSDNLPSRRSAVFDYWGYFTAYTPINGSTDPLYYPQLRVPNLNKTKANILTEIQDMTGSSWLINYAQHNYYKNSSNIAVGGLRVQSISNTLSTGENIQTSYVYENDQGISQGQILTESYANLLTGCTNAVLTVLSEAPTITNDLNGTFIGYSSIKTIQPNGGYTVAEFYNFSDFPDIFNYLAPADNPAPSVTSTISSAYKRGIPKKNTVFNSASVKISETTYSYSSLTSPETKSAWAYKWNYIYETACGLGCGQNFESTYYTKIENYRLTGMISKSYDQLDPNSFMQNSTTYTYSNNKRTIHKIVTTDSKDNTVEETIYYADNSSIPMLTPAEETAITAMLNRNNRDAVIHTTSSRNGAVSTLHNSYAVKTLPDGNTRVFLVNSSPYKNSTLLNNEIFEYDIERSNPISSQTDGGKPTGVLFGYGLNKDAYPIAFVKNAGTIPATEQTTGYGTVFGLSAVFTTGYTGTINLTLSYVSSGGTSPATTNYTLSGPVTRTGTLCLPGGSGGTCSGTPQTIDFTNMPAGTYTLNIVPVSVPFPTTFNYVYPKNIPFLKKEFYYESFEDNPSAIAGSAHTGVKYYNAGSTPFQVNYATASVRNYVIQWWNWENGKWKFNEQAYTGPRSISGIIDDIRIFPNDALMTTHTYEPLVGKTSTIDPSGRTSTIEYDGFSRISVSRDNDKNILTKTCYNYISQPVSCPLPTIFSNVEKSASFTRNNCSAGYSGATILYVVPANSYISTISQADADQLAVNDITVNGQEFANTNGTCIQTWYNEIRSGTFTRNNCSSGSTGGTVTYTVAAGTHSSTTSQAHANLLAEQDVAINGQNFANTNGICTPTSCSFSAASGFTSLYSSIGASGGSVGFSFYFTKTTSGMYAGLSYSIGIINGCRPSVARTISVGGGSNSWEVEIRPDGEVIARYISGPVINAGSSVYLSGSFAL